MAESVGESSKPPCRTCTDFKTWSSKNKIEMAVNEDKSAVVTDEANTKDIQNEAIHRADCPVDKDELGRSTWTLLHTVAAFYPDNPSAADRSKALDFFKSIALMYPCEVCAADFQKQIERFPPKTESQESLSQWLCRAHNRINLRTGKPQFDCTTVNQRWRDGPPDGSCD